MKEKAKWYLKEIDCFLPVIILQNGAESNIPERCIIKIRSVLGIVLDKGSSKIINNLTWIIHMAISYKQTLSLHK